MRESLVTPTDLIQRFLNELANAGIDKTVILPDDRAMYKEGYDLVWFEGKEYTIESFGVFLRQQGKSDANDTAEV